MWFVLVVACAALWFIGGTMAERTLRDPLVLLVFIGCLVSTVLVLVCGDWVRRRPPPE